MSQPPSQSVPPKRSSVNPPVPPVVPVRQPQQSAPPGQPPPEQKGGGCLGCLHTCLLVFLLGLIEAIFLTVLALFALEELELRDDLFRAIELKTGVEMPEHLKDDPVGQQEAEPSEPTSAEPSVQRKPEASKPTVDEPVEQEKPKPPKPAADEPSGENPFIIE